MATSMNLATGSEMDDLAAARSALAGEYLPSADEPYMNARQQDFFRRLLTEWKQSILDVSAGTLQNLQEGPIREPDLNDWSRLRLPFC